MIGQKAFSFLYTGIHCTHTNTKPLLRDGKGFERHLNNMLILKSPSENKNHCTHPAQEKKIKPVALILI